MIDEIAILRAVERYSLHPCLHVPIAAVDEDAIATYVGTIIKVLSGRGARRAFLVIPHSTPEKDLSYPIWDHAGAAVFHQSPQIWVDISYRPYRAAFRRGFPDEQLGEAVLSHAMNRRTAALKGFNFVRITPTSRAANSSSAFSENWGFAIYDKAEQTPEERRQGAFIAYADLTELMLMMDMRLGGGIMDVVNEGQKLIRLRKNA